MSDSVESSNNHHASSDNNSESDDDNNPNIMPSDEDNSNYEYESTSDYNYEEDEEQEEQHISLYNQHPVSCPICCDDKIEEGCAVILPNCSHSFCVACFNAYIVETQIGSGNADNITCPHIVEKVERCNSSVSMEVLHEIMTEESYTRLKEQNENAFVRKNADYHHCPIPNCDNIVLCPQTSDGELRICDCFKCGQTSCLSCGVIPFHISFTCDEYKEYQRRKRARLDRELQSIRFDPFGMSRYNQVDRSRANEETRFDFIDYSINNWRFKCNN